MGSLLQGYTLRLLIARQQQVVNYFCPFLIGLVIKSELESVVEVNESTGLKQL